jgi:hypothetical protein
MTRAGAANSGGRRARHASAHLRRRGLVLLACCAPGPGRDVLLALDPATGELVLAQVSDGSGAADASPVRVDAVLVTLDAAGALARLEHREGIPQRASCW